MLHDCLSLLTPALKLADRRPSAAGRRARHHDPHRAELDAPRARSPRAAFAAADASTGSGASASASIIFLLCVFCWQRGWMGGADVKLLGAAAIAVAPSDAETFLVGGQPVRRPAGAGLPGRTLCPAAPRRRTRPHRHTCRASCASRPGASAIAVRCPMPVRSPPEHLFVSELVHMVLRVTFFALMALGLLGLGVHRLRLDPAAARSRRRAAAAGHGARADGREGNCRRQSAEARRPRREGSADDHRSERCHARQ